MEVTFVHGNFEVNGMIKGNSLLIQSHVFLDHRLPEEEKEEKEACTYSGRPRLDTTRAVP